jgi:hypothetical protein
MRAAEATASPRDDGDTTVQVPCHNKIPLLDGLVILDNVSRHARREL